MTRRRQAAWVLCAVLFAAAAAGAAQPERPAAAARPARYWIVLLDISLSFDQRDREQSQRLNHPGYRLRDEVLTLMQTMLAAERVRQQGLEDTFLEVWVFGGQPVLPQGIPDTPVDWTDILHESDWEAHMPRDLGGRTDYFAALGKAAASFESKHVDAEKRLILISDGELNAGTLNRPARGAIEKQELDYYRNYLRPDNPVMTRLEREKVKVYTFGIDELLNGPNDVERQEEIGHRLHQARLGDSSDLGAALSVVEDIAGRAGRDGRLPYSEGPYVLRALADQFGGIAHSVRYDNVLDVLWDTVFPEQTRRRLVIPPGTGKVIVFAPSQAPIQVRLKLPDQRPNVTLSYDPAKEHHAFEPPELARYFTNVNVHPTAQYAVWVVESPYLDEVALSPQMQALKEQFSLVPVTNVAFAWETGKPPEKLVAGRPVELALDLTRQPDREGPATEEWRKNLSGVAIRASARIAVPNAAPQDVPLTAEVAQGPSDQVLHLRGTFADTRTTGTYLASAEIAVGTEPDVWPLKARPVAFKVLGSSPLAAPGRFALVLRLAAPGGEPGRAAAVPQPAAAGQVGSVDITAEPPARLAVEWWADASKGCEGVRQLDVQLADVLFGPSRDSLDGKPLAEAGHLVCYRSTPQRFGQEWYGRPLRLRAADGLTAWEATLHLKVPEPPWKRLLRWVAAIAGGLLAAALLAVLLVPPWRRALLRAIAARRGDFPLAVEVPGKETFVWERGHPKRFLVQLHPQGVQVEVTGRRPDGGEPAFEVRPFDADGYQLRALAGPLWNLRKLAPSRPPSLPRPLTTEGEIVTFVELARGLRLELDNQGATVVVRHESR